MSTKFVQGTLKSNGQQTSLHDSDSPIYLFLDMQGIEGKDFHPNNWDISLMNYKGDIITKNWDWRNEIITVRLGDLYGK